MTQTVKAIYREGTFIPEVICNLPENTLVELTIEKTRDFQYEVIDPEARQQIIKSIIKRMRQTSLGATQGYPVPQR